MGRTLLVLGVLFLSPSHALAQSAAFGHAPSSEEYKVQAAFIYQFTKYIEWPAERGGKPDKGPFVLTVLDNPPLLLEFEAISRSKPAKGRAMEVRKASDLASLQSSHVVVVGAAEETRLREVMQKTKEASVLIVSAATGFAEKGAMINLFMEGDRLRFEINRTAIEAKQLRASSQLLKLARIIE